ncbi:hypothetical protein F5Y18DRAFT_426537 [Xylariaceae sp. FL1019]|nr:hypothetical protein F5Y18DRAFT_426537 [Xylariaceae sp. FL1019]
MLSKTLAIFCALVASATIVRGVPLAQQGPNTNHTTISPNTEDAEDWHTLNSNHPTHGHGDFVKIRMFSDNNCTTPIPWKHHSWGPAEMKVDWHTCATHSNVGWSSATIVDFGGNKLSRDPLVFYNKNNCASLTNKEVSFNGLNLTTYGNCMTGFGGNHSVSNFWCCLLPV